MTERSVEMPVRTHAPVQPLLHLDDLWVQVAGTLCNLRCTHCLVSAGPGEDHHAFLSRDEVRRHVADALALGVNHVYFTGGEPFLHPELPAILADTLVHAPCTVLTNGTLFTPARIDTLRRLSDTARYSLELRVSLDGATAAEHDTIRGEGTFHRTATGLLALQERGLLPILTVTRRLDEDPVAVRERYAGALRAIGVARPRIKILPLLPLGRAASAPVSAATDLEWSPDPDLPRAPCSRSRAVTSRGVFVCPLLVDEPAARMGHRLSDACRPHTLAHAACPTCWAAGMTCAND
jgi:MoaA/NifB/PqqE/SkfB family radical SAM enzyme